MNKVPQFLLTALGVGVVIAATLALGTYIKGSTNPTTETVVSNVYMPNMEFLTAADTDNIAIHRCKESSDRIVHEFSLAASSILVRQDPKLRSLGMLVFNECLQISTLTILDIVESQNEFYND